MADASRGQRLDRCPECGLLGDVHPAKHLPALARILVIAWIGCASAAFLGWMAWHHWATAAAQRDAPTASMGRELFVGRRLDLGTLRAVARGERSGDLDLREWLDNDVRSALDRLVSVDSELRVALPCPSIWSEVHEFRLGWPVSLVLFQKNRSCFDHDPTTYAEAQGAIDLPLEFRIGWRNAVASWSDSEGFVRNALVAWFPLAVGVTFASIVWALLRRFSRRRFVLRRASWWAAWTVLAFTTLFPSSRVQWELRGGGVQATEAEPLNFTIREALDFASRPEAERAFASRVVETIERELVRPEGSPGKLAIRRNGPETVHGGPAPSRDVTTPAPHFEDPLLPLIVVVSPTQPAIQQHDFTLRRGSILDLRLEDIPAATGSQYGRPIRLFKNNNYSQVGFDFLGRRVAIGLWPAEFLVPLCVIMGIPLSLVMLYIGLAERRERKRRREGRCLRCGYSLVLVPQS